LGIIVCYYFKALVGKSINSATDNVLSVLTDKVAHLESDVASLNEQIKSFSAAENMRELQYDPWKQKERWKTWMTLCDKLESCEPFEAELAKFNELFAHDDELISLVKDFTDRVNASRSGKGGSFIELCKNAIHRVLRFNCGRRRKLIEITGYVLLSCSVDADRKNFEVSTI
jgi:hypothetical protein